MFRVVNFLAGCALLVFVCGCSGGSGGGGPVVPEDNQMPYRITPMGAWGGLQWSLDASDPSGWLEALGSTFHYVPDPVTAAQYPGAFASWDRSRELDFVQFLFASGMEFNAVMAPIGFVEPAPVGSEVEWESVAYSVKVADANGGNPVVFGGTARLEFRLEGNFWYLVAWEDLAGSPVPWAPGLEFPTLGHLRAVSPE